MTLIARATLVAATLTIAWAGRAHPEEHAGHGEPVQSEHATHIHPGGTDTSTVSDMTEVDVPVDRRQLIGVRTERIEIRPLARRLRTAGIVAADERRVRKIQTRVSGWVQELFVSFTGQPVKAGEAVLSLYSPDLFTAQREYLLARGAGADNRSLLDAARTRLRLWNVTDGQIADLERTGQPQQTVVLHSPIAGVVTIKPVAQGMYVTPEMELYTVADLGAVWIWADVYEPDANLVTPGMPASITLPSAPDDPRTATVSYINPTLDTATRTVRVRVDVPNASGALKPGMYATVEIDAALGDALSVPSDAVIDTGERRVVFVQVADGRYQPRAVQLGRRAGAYVEVVGGLSPGDLVVVSAQFLLDSESRLRSVAGGPGHGAH